MSRLMNTVTLASSRPANNINNNNNNSNSITSPAAAPAHSLGLPASHHHAQLVHHHHSYLPLTPPALHVSMAPAATSTTVSSASPASGQIYNKTLVESDKQKRNVTLEQIRNSLQPFANAGSEFIAAPSCTNLGGGRTCMTSSASGMVMHQQQHQQGYSLNGPGHPGHLQLAQQQHSLHPAYTPSASNSSLFAHSASSKHVALHASISVPIVCNLATTTTSSSNNNNNNNSSVCDDNNNAGTHNQPALQSLALTMPGEHNHTQHQKQILRNLAENGFSEEMLKVLTENWDAIIEGIRKDSFKNTAPVQQQQQQRSVVIDRQQQQQESSSPASLLRSGSPVANGSKASVPLLPRDRLLPDQPRILNSSKDRAQASPPSFSMLYHASTVDTPPGSSSSHLHPSSASSSSSGSPYYHVQPQPCVKRSKDPPVYHQVLGLVKSTTLAHSAAAVAAGTTFRPTDPLPPPPLPPHRTVASKDGDGKCSNNVPPPLPPHHPTAGSSLQEATSMADSNPPPLPPAYKRFAKASCQQASSCLAPTATPTSGLNRFGSSGAMNVSRQTLEQRTDSLASVNGLASQLTAKLQNLSLAPVVDSSPPSYAASNSSGRQSITPTLSSNASDYSSVRAADGSSAHHPPSLPAAAAAQTFKMLAQQFSCTAQAHQLNVSSNASLQAMITGSTSSLASCSSYALNSSSTSSSQSSLPQHSLQPWSARQAISQSPIIMKSVKSHQVLKPMLQTAVAPTIPPINVKTTVALSTPITSKTTSLATAPSLEATNAARFCSPPSSVKSHSAAAKNPPPYSSVQFRLQAPPPNADLDASPSSSSVASVVNHRHHVNHEQRPPAVPPPPPYSSAVHQQGSNQRLTATTTTLTTTTSTTMVDVGKQSISPVASIKPQSPPPPPPPPPYSMSLAMHQQDSIAQIISGLTGGPMAVASGFATQSVPSGSSSVSSFSCSASAPAGCGGAGVGAPIVSIPTTDPPSYASSMKALAAQRAASCVTNTRTTLVSSATTLPTLASGSIINSLMSDTYSCSGAPQSGRALLMAGAQAQQCSAGELSNASNCDLVNTVESICTSHISALQSGLPGNRSSLTEDASTSVCPPLPPKPSSQAPPAVPPLPALRHHLQKQQQHAQLDAVSLASSSDGYDTDGRKTESEKVAADDDDGEPKQTYHSPIPKRKNICQAKEKERREYKVSPAAFKFYMEQHFENLIKQHKQRERRRLQLESEIASLNVSEQEQIELRKFLRQKESNHIRLRRAKMHRSMFKKLKKIGVGAFGSVSLVYKTDETSPKRYYAMKTLRKSNVLKQKQVAHVKAERDILAEADNEWVVKLYYSFQDDKRLYFVMDYIPGGDLMSLLINKSVFDEDLARFYIAELVLAVESVHKMGFIHRDIKPDNILIDIDGHIKLTDFGLCTGFRWTHNSMYYHDRNNSMDFDELRNTTKASCRCTSTHQLNCAFEHQQLLLSKPLERRRRRDNQRCLAHSLVGTPNYIAPEVLMLDGYTQLCDWWSVGVILYEMIVGQPPFWAETTKETQYKIIHWRDYLNVPTELRIEEHNIRIRPEAKNLIERLCCAAQDRLGKNGGAEEIKRHPFFKAIDFERGLRNQKAPWKPTICYPTDTSNFDLTGFTQDSSDDDCDNVEYEDPYKDNDSKGFLEFTFRRFFDVSGQGSSYSAIKGNDGEDTSFASSVLANKKLAIDCNGNDAKCDTSDDDSSRRSPASLVQDFTGSAKATPVVITTGADDGDSKPSVEKLEIKVNGDNSTSIVLGSTSTTREVNGNIPISRI